MVAVWVASGTFVFGSPEPVYPGQPKQELGDEYSLVFVPSPGQPVERHFLTGRTHCDGRT